MKVSQQSEMQVVEMSQTIPNKLQFLLIFITKTGFSELTVQQRIYSEQKRGIERTSAVETVCVSVCVCAMQCIPLKEKYSILVAQLNKHWGEIKRR